MVCYVRESDAELEYIALWEKTYKPITYCTSNNQFLCKSILKNQILKQFSYMVFKTNE